MVGLASTAYFRVALDAVFVITALPRMQRDLHVSLSSLQWTLNAYGIAVAVNYGLVLFTSAAPPASPPPGRRRRRTAAIASV